MTYQDKAKKLNEHWTHFVDNVECSELVATALLQTPHGHAPDSDITRLTWTHHHLHLPDIHLQPFGHQLPSQFFLGPCHKDEI